MRSPAGRWGPGCSEVEVRIERREPGRSTEAQHCHRRLALCPVLSPHVSRHPSAILGDGLSPPFTDEDAEALSGEATGPRLHS